MWITITSVIAGQGIFQTIFILLNRSRIRKELLPIGIMLLCCTMVLIESILIWSKYIYYVPFLNGWLSVYLALIGPLALVSLLMYTGVDLKPKFYCFFLIPTLLLVLNIPYIFMNIPVKQELYTRIAQVGIPAPYGPKLKLSYMIATLSNVGYGVWMLFKKDSFATKGKRAIQFIWFINLFAFANVLTLIINRLGMSRPLYDHANILVMAVLIYSLGYLMNANTLISEIPKKLAKRYEKSSLTVTATQSIIKRLQKLLAENQLYLDPELRLSQLAEEVGTTTHLLSQVINETMQTSYSDLITKYRLQYAKEMMAGDVTEKYLLKEISFRSGFNNKTSFNQAFKKSSGLTPSQFRRKLLTQHNIKKRRS